MSEPSLLQRTLNAARDFVSPKPKNRKGIDKSYPIGHWKDDDAKPMERGGFMNAQERAQSDVKGFDSVYGKGSLRKEVKAGRDPIVPGAGGFLPRFDAPDGTSRGGFFDVPLDKAGNPMGPAKSYASPATHFAPREPLHRERFLLSQYNFRQSRGEILPPWLEWLDAQGKERGKAKIDRQHK